MAKFLIADDHPLFREALILSLKAFFEPMEVVESDSLDSTLEVLEQNQDVDLILLDLNMPGCESFYGLMRVSRDFPDIPVVVVSASESPQVVAQVMTFGARGFIPKSTASADISVALRAIVAGDTWLPSEFSVDLAKIPAEQKDLASKVAELTPKQFQVLKLLRDGLLNKQIAYDLNVTEATVKAHISAIFRKFNVSNRTQAVLMAEKLQYHV